MNTVSLGPEGSLLRRGNIDDGRGRLKRKFPGMSGRHPRRE